MLLDSDLLLCWSLTEHAPKLRLLSMDSTIITFHNTFSMLSKHMDQAHANKQQLFNINCLLKMFISPDCLWKESNVTGYLRHLILDEINLRRILCDPFVEDQLWRTVMKEIFVMWMAWGDLLLQLTCSGKYNNWSTEHKFAFWQSRSSA